MSSPAVETKQDQPAPGIDPARLERVKRGLRARGVNLSAWCREHGVSRDTVNKLLTGKRKALRGEGHRAAVMLDLIDDAVE